jgi:hypothetical protein
MATTAVALGFNPFQGVPVDRDEYYNHRLGLRFREPPGWEFDSIADFAALRDRQILRSLWDDAPWDDEEEVHPLKDPTSLPVFLLFDPKHRQGEFAPSVALWDEELDLPVPRNSVAGHRRMLREFAAAYRNFEYIRRPTIVTVAGMAASESVWSYLHEIDDGQSWSLRVRSIVIFSPPRVHTYHLVDSAVQQCIPEEVFDTFLGTVTYEAL